MTIWIGHKLSIKLLSKIHMPFHVNIQKFNIYKLAAIVKNQIALKSTAIVINLEKDVENNVNV